jgi:hypothetical protein
MEKEAVSTMTHEAGKEDIVPTKPKRPLSSFNLFYRYKRMKALEAIANNGAVGKEAISMLLLAAPGLENFHLNANVPTPPDDDLRRQNIRMDMGDDLSPRDTRKRVHRTNEGAMNGLISFLELGNAISTSWKNCDSLGKAVFNELAEEARNQYRQRMQEYNSKMASMKTGENAGSPSISSKGGDSAAHREAYAMLRAVSNDLSSPGSSPPVETNTSLRARVRELEGELNAERLRMRVRDLEDQLARREMANQSTLQAALLSLMPQSVASMQGQPDLSSPVHLLQLMELAKSRSGSMEQNAMSSLLSLTSTQGTESASMLKGEGTKSAGEGKVAATSEEEAAAVIMSKLDGGSSTVSDESEKIESSRPVKKRRLGT